MGLRHSLIPVIYSSQLPLVTEVTKKGIGAPKNQCAYGHIIRKSSLGFNSKVCTQQGEFLHLFPFLAAQLPLPHIPGASKQLFLACSPYPGKLSWVGLSWVGQPSVLNVL